MVRRDLSVKLVVTVSFREDLRFFDMFGSFYIYCLDYFFVNSCCILFPFLVFISVLFYIIIHLPIVLIKFEISLRDVFLCISRQFK